MRGTIFFICLLLASITASAEVKNLKRSSLGMGLNGIADWSTQMPFLDLMKQARAWRDWNSKVNNELGFDTDENDWIKSLKKGQAAGTVFLVSPRDEPVIYQRYVVLYDGEGVINYRWGAKKINQESRPGRDIITVSPGNNLLEISKTDPANFLRNIKIIPEKHIKFYLAGHTFNPDWLKRIKNFNTLRFMDWMKTNHSLQSQWRNRPLITHRSWAPIGVPLEVMIELSNITSSNPWFNIPHLADQDYIAEFAKLVKRTLKDALSVYIEHSNEVWNWQFKQAQYANTAGRERWPGIGTAYMQWHGMRTAQICDIFKGHKQSPKNIAPKAQKQPVIKCVLGTQTGWQGLETAALECPEWVKEGHAPCYSHGIDYIGITTYFNGKLNGPVKSENPAYSTVLKQWASSGDKGIEQAFAQLNTGKPLQHIPAFKDYQGIEKQLAKNMTYWRSAAKKYQLALVAYEGGQHITANGHLLQNNSAVTQFHQTINEDPKMTAIYTHHLTKWQQLGGELNVLFVDIGAPSKWGSWGALKRVDQVSSPKWDAIQTFNTQTPCWWEACAIAN